MLPRFMSPARFPGCSFKRHGDGWRVAPGAKSGKGQRNGVQCIPGVGYVRACGQARDSGEVLASEVMRRYDQRLPSFSTHVDSPLRLDHAVLTSVWRRGWWRTASPTDTAQSAPGGDVGGGPGRHRGPVGADSKWLAR